MGGGGGVCGWFVGLFWVFLLVWGLGGVVLVELIDGVPGGVEFFIWWGGVGRGGTQGAAPG